MANSNSSAPKWSDFFFKGVFPVITLFLGSYLNTCSSYNTFLKQKRYESQRVTFSNIVARKTPWMQYIRVHLEADMLTQYYLQLHRLTKNETFLNESIKANDRVISSINDISQHQQAILENIALIETYFSVDKRLRSVIDSIYSFQAITLARWPQFNTDVGLDSAKSKTERAIDSTIAVDFGNKVDALIAVLRDKLK